MKSEVFNGSRFWTYFKYDLMQMWRNHVKAAILIGFSGLILYVLGISFNALIDKVWQAPSFNARAVVFMIALFALELYQTRTYGYLTNRRKGAAWLMVPASGFEKWLSMMIMTLLVIPVAFLFTYTAIDGILSLADPTYGPMLLGSFKGALQKVSVALAQANAEYSTTWTLGLFIVPMIASYMLNFLYFLLCGICFRRNKILWAFLIMFGASILLSMGMTAFGLKTHYDVDDLCSAEIQLRAILNWTSAITFAISACLAGGIYYRIKTLKH